VPHRIRHTAGTLLETRKKAESTVAASMFPDKLQQLAPTRIQDFLRDKMSDRFQNFVIQQQAMCLLLQLLLKEEIKKGPTSKRYSCKMAVLKGESQ
jgi:hypothetical protein